MSSYGKSSIGKPTNTYNTSSTFFNLNTSTTTHFLNRNTYTTFQYISLGDSLHKAYWFLGCIGIIFLLLFVVYCCINHKLCFCQRDEVQYAVRASAYSILHQFDGHLVKMDDVEYLIEIEEAGGESIGSKEVCISLGVRKSRKYTKERTVEMCIPEKEDDPVNNPYSKVWEWQWEFFAITP